MSRFGYVYMLASKPNGTLYTGVTSNLSARVEAHRKGRGAVFTRRYNVHRLVWFERHDLIADAIGREKQLKSWNRAWKIELIQATNPDWNDLSDQLHLIG